ncbi:Bug family tripartite tricarboxylate transporter substrate binding protein [Polynucleobacter rarus]|uniref:Bug family tripartite tricarboxylate transporter substrate binding protein n=1 Tax=Polynucleobacter rarus TaxID=556055 RepID=UPI000D3EA78E|nr:tripartite tricarboxylate transporter substrate binding protein [Polynucleobacter rarus]
MTQWQLMRNKAIHLTTVLLFSIGLGLTHLNGFAQAFPSKPIKLISGATAGSASDIIARSIAEKLQNEFGVSVIVENKPGAAGTLAIQTILNSPADGHSVFVYTGAHTVLPLLNKVSYDPVKDFSAVVPLAVVPNVMVVSPNKGYKSVKDVVAAAKNMPGQLNYASAGLGSATHMSAEKFKLATGIDAVHVPYKGSPEAITETMTGRIDYFFAPLVSALPMIKAGKLIPLAVSTPKRSSQLPDVPTLAEAGVAKSEYLFWIGMLVSSKTPRDIVNKLNQSTLKALQDNEVKERLVSLGAEALPMTPEQFDQLIKDELTANAVVIKAAGIKSE